MKYLKRFTDFCGGFAAFCAIIYSMTQFIMYNPSEEMGTLEKVKHFFFGNYSKNFNAYVVMIALLIASVVIGTIFERFPFVSLSVSSIPFLWILFMFVSGWLYDRPMLYIVLSIVHMSGSVIYALMLDKVDGKRRAYWCVNSLGALVGALCLAIWKKSEVIRDVKFTEDELRELSDIDSELFMGLEGDSARILFVIGVMLLVGVVVSLLLRDVYYIDVILCAVPCIYSLRAFFSEELTMFGGVAFSAVAVCFIFRVLVMISEPMRKPKVKKECQT